MTQKILLNSNGRKVTFCSDHVILIYCDYNYENKNVFSFPENETMT